MVMRSHIFKHHLYGVSYLSTDYRSEHTEPLEDKKLGTVVSVLKTTADLPLALGLAA